MSFNARKAIFGSPDVDPYFSNTSLLLHGDGIGLTPNGQQNKTFLDSSSNVFLITTNGTATQGSFNPYPASSLVYDPLVNGGSGYFNGTTDSLKVATNPAFDFSTNDFKIEFWANLNNITGNKVLIDRWAANVGWQILYRSTGSSITFYVNNAVLVQDPNPSTITLSTWNHIAVTRDSGLVKLWINGIVVASATFTGSLNSTIPLGIAYQQSTNTNWVNGYLCDVRIQTGIGSPVVVPTYPLTNTGNTVLLLNFTNAGIFDNTQKNNLKTISSASVDTTIKKYGLGSLNFNGTTNYLVAPTNTNLNFGNGDFTIESWIYITTFGTMFSKIILDSRPDNSNGAFYIFYVLPSKKLGINISSSSFSSIGFLSLNTWTHVAATRQSGLLRLFINGNFEGSTNMFGLANASQLLVGTGAFRSAAPDNYWSGNIDDVRITKNVARYIASFTPPQRAFPNR